MLEKGPSATAHGGDKTLAILVHIGGLFFSWLAPLIIYLIKKGENDEYTTAHAREALNFQITVLIAYVGCFILTFVLIGILLFWVVMLGNLILSIMAAIKASNGEHYQYPLTLRLVK